MAMRKTVLTIVAASAAALAFAQENETKVDSGEQASAEGEVATTKAPTPQLFTALPLCRLAENGAEVLLPLETAWSKAEEGRFYPLGARYRTRAGGKLMLMFGPESSVTIEGESEFATRVQPLSEKSKRIIELCRGTVSVDFARNTPQGAFFVSAPGFTVKNLAGESRYVYENRGDGDFVSVRCVTGTLGLEGLHFDIAELRAANELHIRTTRDRLTTFLYGVSGDFIVKIDQGVVTKAVVGDEGERKEVTAKSVLDWHLSPETKVRIDRLRLAVDGPMSVAVMAFDAAGELRHNFAFAEGCAEVNSGELVAAPKQEVEDVAKRAAEATETSAADAEDAKAEDAEGEEKKEEKKADDE